MGMIGLSGSWECLAISWPSNNSSGILSCFNWNMLFRSTRQREYEKLRLYKQQQTSNHSIESIWWKETYPKFNQIMLKPHFCHCFSRPMLLQHQINLTSSTASHHLPNPPEILAFGKGLQLAILSCDSQPDVRWVLSEETVFISWKVS